MSQQEASLVAVQDRASALASEAERSHHTAKSDAATLLEQARSEAGALVASAREQAERIKRDSDRELAAATARRDSITAQLTNCLLYTSDAADDLHCVDPGGRRIIKKTTRIG